MVKIKSPQSSSDMEDLEEDLEEEEQVDLNSSNIQTQSKKKHAGLMDALVKIIKTSKNEENQILSKAKNIEKKMDEEEMLERAKRMMTREQKQKMRRDHVHPSFYHPESEKKLKNVATKGVVRLFNAFQTQKSVQKKDGISLRKDEQLKAAKQAFINRLRNTSVGHDMDVEVSGGGGDINKSKSGKASWATSEFMMDPGMKDWDLSSEAEEE